MIVIHATQIIAIHAFIISSKKKKIIDTLFGWFAQLKYQPH